MKKIVLIITAIFFIHLSFAQKDFKWERIDSVAKTKERIYSDTKMFIATRWKSANTVIQNDDKDGGVILVKAIYVNGSKGGIFDNFWFEYTYAYNVTFRMKDGKYKINIDNVICESGYLDGGQGRGAAYLVQPFEYDGKNCPETSSSTLMGLSCKKLVPIISSLQVELQMIVMDYEKYIKTPSSKSDGW